MGNLKLTSSAFEDGGEIPRKYGYKNGNVSPPLTIDGISTEVKSLALIMDDPDAMDVVIDGEKPYTEPYVHWVVWNIRTDSKAEVDSGLYGNYYPTPTRINIPESAGNIDVPMGSDARKFLSESGNSQGTTDFEEVGYGGPAPPFKRHTYVFKLYALDIFTDSKGNPLLDVKHGASKADLEKAMEDHIIEQTQLTGTYAP